LCVIVLPLQRMNLIIKGDTSGVVEAIKGALQGLPQVRQGLEFGM
jgi:translation initiation factor IF-2